MAKQSRKPAPFESFLRTIPNGRPVSMKILNVAVVRKDDGPEIDPSIPPSGFTTMRAPCIVYVDGRGNTRTVTTPETVDMLLTPI
jgi:hypothetical protein